MDGIPDSDWARAQPLPNSQLDQEQGDALHNHHLQMQNIVLVLFLMLRRSFTYNQVGNQEGAAPVLLQQEREAPNIAWKWGRKGLIYISVHVLKNSTKANGVGEDAHEELGFVVPLLADIVLRGILGIKVINGVGIFVQNLQQLVPTTNHHVTAGPVAALQVRLEGHRLGAEHHAAAQLALAHGQMVAELVVRGRWRRADLAAAAAVGLNWMIR